MSKKPDFDHSAAHKYFSTNCFNQAWDLIEKTDRTSAEDEDMIRLSLASHYHWTQREDYSDTGASIAYWQTSHIYAVLGQADNARRYGQLCLNISQAEEIPPFFLGYAYEALARAESTAGNRKQAQEYIDQAKSIAEKIQEADDKKQLLNDLNTIT
jgi:tetratricopeptide (TPR) repeat protein